MSKYFNILELCHSDTADMNHIDNTPSEEIKEHLEELMEFLDGLRKEWGSPIRITSGYRCPQLNKKVGGVPTSAHQIGYAVDMQPIKRPFKDFVEFVKNYLSDKEYDQLLLETSSKGTKWIHLGLYNQKGEQRKQIKNLYVKK